MKAFIIGVLMVGAGAYLVLPYEWALGWTDEMLETLKGITPIVLAVGGLLAMLLGVADIRDRAEARREAERQAE